MNEFFNPQIYFSAEKAIEKVADTGRIRNHGSKPESHMNGPGSFCRRKRFTWRTGVIVVLSLCAYRLVSAEKPNSAPEKLPVLKVGNEVYSNVTVTAVTATDIYFTHSRGMGNVKLERLDPELQKKFHFDPKKASQTKIQQQQINANYRSWISRQTNSHPAQAELPPVVSIEVADPAVQYKYFNNSQSGKPEDFQEGTLADTDSDFICEPEFDVLPVRGTNGGPFAFRIEAVKLSVGLPTTIRLPLGASQKIKEHEDGHRHINEYFYTFARKAAERAIQVTLTNRFLKSEATNVDSAEADFVQKAKMMVESAYWQYTRWPSRPANEYYDELTDHARNEADSGEAAQKAIERYSVKIPDEATDVTFASENKEPENEEQNVTANFRPGFRSSPRVNPNETLVSTREPQPYITVQTSDEAVQYKDYDPIYDRPLNLEESDQARIDREFSFEVEFTIHPAAQTNSGRFAFQIDTTKTSIGLTMTITEPSSPNLRLKNHLAGLKHIYEHFYALGPKAAERAGQFVGSGLWIHPDAKNQATAEAMFLGRAKAAAEMEYWNYTRFPAETAKQYYENLTDHGEGLADSEQAAQEAIQKAEVKIPDGPIDATPAWLESKQ